jgi:hypothetical protein
MIMSARKNKPRAATRTAERIVAEYVGARGYRAERVRALANTRPEPLRSEILELLKTVA